MTNTLTWDGMVEALAERAFSSHKITWELRHWPNAWKDLPEGSDKEHFRSKARVVLQDLKLTPERIEVLAALEEVERLGYAIVRSFEPDGTMLYRLQEPEEGLVIGTGPTLPAALKAAGENK